MESGTCWELLAGLPQPRHLYAHVTRTHHLHLGCFSRASEPLHAALDRMVLRGLPRLASGRRLLDAGCGIGGSSALLAARGYDCLGIDPCASCVAFGRRHARAGCRFRHCRIEDLGAPFRQAFDNVLLIEVCQFHQDLDRLFAHVLALLRPGGRVVLADVATTVPVAFADVPFHRRGQRRLAAEAAGLQTVDEEDLTAAVQPTFPALQRELAQLDGRLPPAPGRSLPGEVEELVRHCGLLQSAFAASHFVYEYLVLERPWA